jgi:hypothetical protein
MQEIHATLAAHNQQVQATLSQVAGQRELTRQQFEGILAVLWNAYDTMCAMLKKAGPLRLPALKNVTSGESLEPFLLNQPPIPRLSGGSNRVDGEWIGRFLKQLGEVIEKTERIHFKSLGGILALQEKTAEQWSGPERPAVPPAEGEPVTAPEVVAQEPG